MKEQHGFLNMFKLGIILALFAAAACVMLACVYTGTKKTIEKRQQDDLNAALDELFPGAQFESVKDIKIPDPKVVIERDKNDPENTGAFKALQNGEIIGVALRLSTGSYGGPIKIMAGVSAEGTITGVKIMEHSDTPGLGANAASPSYFVDREKRITFYGQFTGKSVTDPFEVKDDVAAITASTVTSRAVTAAVKAAGLGVTAWLAGVSVDVISGASEGGAE